MKLATRAQVDILREKNILKSPLEEGLTIASKTKKGNGKTYYLRDDLWTLSSFYLNINQSDESVIQYKQKKNAKRYKVN